MTEGLVPDLEKALADHWTTEEGRKDLSVNLTETVRTRIPIGTTVEDAKAVMQLAGFTVKGGLLKNVPAGMDDGLAGVLVSPIGGAIFADRSFNILLGVKDNRIESIVAWAAFRAL